MKKGDLIWGFIIICILFIIVSPFTKEEFITFTINYPYLGGFIKFAILATMGEMLAMRIKSGNWIKLSGLFYRILVWGLIGIGITLIFVIFATGVESAIHKGFLPGLNSIIIKAFLTSAIMNIIFGPTMMGFHKLTDSYLELRFSMNQTSVTMKQIIENVDWYGFINFAILKTIPLFWIPAHTITFLLPSEYRVIAAALLSIALGILLAISKKVNKQ